MLVETLVAAGVERIYGLVGDSLNALTEALQGREDLRWIPVRHEETAAFAAGAEASGMLGLKAETPGQVRPVIARALAHDGPALVEVHVARHELSMPPTLTLEQVEGFGLFMLKAALSGHGDELIDLAKVNLRG
jgi:thiamine pyrophosphate-dependent acetolactate synthase large subunit-like protein